MIIYCDGGSRGNPGKAASAFVATQDDVVIHKESRYLGIETNNVAEYTAVLLATKWLVKQIRNKNEEISGACHDVVIINLDSQLVERQLNGKYKVKNAKLKTLFDQIKLLINNSNIKIMFQWNYRVHNSLADKLVNDALDSTGKQ